jgi:hypothetical protein
MNNEKEWSGRAHLLGRCLDMPWSWSGSLLANKTSEAMDFF